MTTQPMYPGQPRLWPSGLGGLAGAGVLSAVLIASAAVTGCGGAHPAAGHHAPAAPAQTPHSADPASPATSVSVEFVVTGTAQAGADIQFGAGSRLRYGPGQINGNATKVPWQGSVAFTPSAQFYLLSAQLYGPGTLDCKIVVLIPGNRSLTVATGHASGKFSTCSVQVKPTSPSGLRWEQE